MTRKRRSEPGQPLTIGQMAKLNAVSEKALRIYQAKGILEPARTDPETGYRYYTLEQCAALDMIQQMRTVGFSLDEISESLARKDVAGLRDQVRDHVERIEENMRELAAAHQVGADMLRACEVYLDKPPCGRIMVETLPERHALEFDLATNVANPDADGQTAIEAWELTLREIRRTIVQNGWPLSLFRNVGCIIAREDLLAGRIAYNRAFVFVTPAFGDDVWARASTIPGGTYLTEYQDGVLTEDGRERETVALSELLETCAKLGVEPAGDYVGEIIADGPAFNYSGREMLFRMCLPIRAAGQTDWHMPAQRSLMNAWRGPHRETPWPPEP